MDFKSDTKKFRMYADNTYKCKCGHSIAIPKFINKKICRITLISANVVTQ